MKTAEIQAENALRTECCQVLSKFVVRHDSGCQGHKDDWRTTDHLDLHFRVAQEIVNEIGNGTTACAKFRACDRLDYSWHPAKPRKVQS